MTSPLISDFMSGYLPLSAHVSSDRPPVYLHLIFEISSVTWFFFNFKLKKKSILKQTRFFVEFELDFYCLCSLQKSISKSNWFFDFLNLIFRNWKKIKWHSIFQKSSGDRKGVRIFFFQFPIFQWNNEITNSKTI